MSKSLVNPDNLERVRAKTAGMNAPMTGNPDDDNITLLPHQPPIFHNVPDYTMDKNPFSFLYIDTTYKCNMECGFCMTPIRHYKDLDIKVFEELCASLPRPVQMRLVGAEPTLWKHLFEAINIGTKYGHSIAIVTNGIRLAQKVLLRS